jgi:hypothetical protein
VWHSDLHRPFDPPPPPRPPPLPSSASASSLIGLSKKEVKRRAGVAIAKALAEKGQRTVERKANAL